MEQRLRELTFGKAFGAGVVLVVLYYFIMYNDGTVLQSTISQTNTEIQTQEAELSKIKTAVADAERYQNTKRALGAELDSVLKAIPAQLTVQDLMKIVSNEAKSIGVNLSVNPVNLNSSAEVKDKFFEPVAVTVSLDGTYNQLMTFLSSVTKVDKIITLSSLNLAAASQSVEETGPLTLKLTAEMRAYRYLPQSVPREEN